MSALTDRCKLCGHLESEHLANMFGTACRGRDWHWPSDHAPCSCEGFVEALAGGGAA